MKSAYHLSSTHPQRQARENHLAISSWRFGSSLIQGWVFRHDTAETVHAYAWVGEWEREREYECWGEEVNTMASDNSASLNKPKREEISNEQEIKR